MGVAGGDGTDDDDLVAGFEAAGGEELLDGFADERFGFTVGEGNDDGINAPVKAERLGDLFVGTDCEDG